MKKNKKKLALWLGTGSFLAIGLVALLVGFAMTGWSIIDWLKSDYAITTFVLLGVGALVLLVVWFNYKRIHLGD